MYRISLYGKHGCSKCAQLKARLDKLINSDWQDFEVSYHDITTEDGMVDFALRECLNPQRIPSFIVEKKVAGTDNFEPIRNPAHDSWTSGVRPMRYLGIQTDYTEVGKGIIPPAVVVDVMKQAKAIA